MTRRTTPARATVWFAMYVVLVLAGGALLGAVLIRMGLDAESGFWSRLIETHGPSRVLRRIQTLLAIMLAPLLLKKIGWEGMRNLGWNSEQTRGERKRDFLVWFSVGAGIMVSIFAISLITGVRVWRPFSAARWLTAILTGVLITGIGVGFIEETLTRGVLYRTLARAWTPWTAAVLSSVLFAWAHFMKADPASFEVGPFAVLVSSLFADFAHSAVPLKFLNLFVFGVLLCRLVHHRGDIWAAVGLHAAAVGCIKWFGRQTEFDRSVPYQAWIGGHSAKFNDGMLLTSVLILLLVWVEWRNRKRLSSYGHVRL